MQSRSGHTLLNQPLNDIMVLIARTLLQKITPRPCRFMCFFVFNGEIPPQRFVALGRTGTG